MAILLRYSWPGNVREVHNIIERLVITTKGSTILPENIPQFIHASVTGDSPRHPENLTLRNALEEAEKDILRRAYKKYRSTRTMAKVLEVSQPTVVRKLNKYGIPQSEQG